MYNKSIPAFAVYLHVVFLRIFVFGTRKPTDNDLIELFSGRLSDEFPNVQEIITLHDAGKTSGLAGRIRLPTPIAHTVTTTCS